MRYLLIVNPSSGAKKKEKIVSLIKERFSEDELEVVYTQKKGDAITFAKKSTHHVVIVLGGDGTVNEVVNGLMSIAEIKRPKLAIFPVGTANVVARDLGIKKKTPKEILELIDCERSRRIDVGKANERYFLVGSGVGLDAHAYERVKPGLKKMVGEAAYPLALLKTFVDYEPKELTIEICGEMKKGYYVLVCNITQYRFIELIKDGKNYDGEFDVLIFQKKNLLDNLRYMYGVLTKKTHTFRDVEHIRCNSLQIISKEAVSYHVDAEVNGTTPVEISIVKKGLEIIC